MVETRDLTEFFKLNDNDLRRYLRSRGVWDDSIIDDLTQDFYVKVKAEKLLAKYDPQRGVYTNYIFVIMASVISNYFKRTKPVPDLPTPPETSDVWERIREFRDWLLEQPHAPQLINDFERRVEGRTDRTCSSTILFCQYLKVYKSLNSIMGVTGCCLV